MTLSSSVREIALPNDNDCCEENIQSQSKKPQQTMLMGNRNQPIAIIATATAGCMVVIVSLFASAFTADPSLECSAEGDVSVTTETSQTIIAFVTGWAFCLIAKYRQDLVGTIVCAAKQLSAFISSSASSILSALTLHYQSTGGWFANQGPRIKSILAITIVCAMCSGCIIGLFVSAFTAVPDEEPTDNGFASESSQTVKAFTVGWMFLLSFKLRHELVGVVGSSCLLQPC